MSSEPVVVLVEDNAELRGVLKEALTAEGYEVLGARDASEALELLRSNTVHLLISDLTDPPAPSALDEIREEFPELPVVALSPDGAGHPTLFFGAWGGEGRYRTLPRPFRLAELLAVSREVLGGSERVS